MTCPCKTTAIENLPKIRGGLYSHYKGGLYWAPGTVVIEEETGFYRVVYYSIVKKVWWARPFINFFEMVPDMNLVPRFVRRGGHFAALWAVISNRSEL